MAVRTSGSTAVQNLGEFRRALKQLEGDYPKQLGKVNQKVAQVVVDEATKRAQAEGGSYLAALRRGGIKASKAQTAAMVVLGGAKAPMALGAEFGSKRFAQFKRWTGSGDQAGYALWPAIRAKQDAAAGMYLDELDTLAARAFPKKS